MSRILTALPLCSALLTFVLWLSAAIGPPADASQQRIREESFTGQIARVQIGSTVYIVEVARTPEEMVKGLMGRRSLPENGGMLFLFKEPQVQGFWMKNTLIPLDIIFITDDKRIESFHTMQPCVADPCPIYPSKGKVKYALEVNAGEVAKHRFAVGNKVTLRLQKHAAQ